MAVPNTTILYPCLNCPIITKEKAIAGAFVPDGYNKQKMAHLDDAGYRARETNQGRCDQPDNHPTQRQFGDCFLRVRKEKSV